jgi:hypothetical protein
MDDIYINGCKDQQQYQKIRQSYFPEQSVSHASATPIIQHGRGRLEMLDYNKAEVIDYFGCGAAIFNDSGTNVFCISILRA